MNKRFCVLLGIAILGVVISHAAGYGEIAMFYWPHRYRDVISPNFDKLGSLDYYLILLIRQLVSFSVAVFMFVSGYFVSFAGKSAGKLSWNFVKHRLVKLLIPYTIWSFVWLCFYLFLGSPLPLSSAIRLFFTKGVTNSYFYIPLLSSFYILSPFLFLFVKRNVRAFLYFCFSVSVVILSIRYLDLFFDTPWIDWCINFISGYIVFYRWIIYFGIGMGAGINLTEFKSFLDRHQKKLAFITPIFFILVLVEPEVIYRATSMQISWKNTPFPFPVCCFRFR